MSTIIYMDIAAYAILEWMNLITVHAVDLRIRLDICKVLVCPEMPHEL